MNRNMIIQMMVLIDCYVKDVYGIDEIGGLH